MKRNSNLIFALRIEFGEKQKTPGGETRGVLDFYSVKLEI